MENLIGTIFGKNSLSRRILDKCIKKFIDKSLEMDYEIFIEKKTKEQSEKSILKSIKD